MVINTQYHKESFTRVLCFILVKDIGRRLPGCCQVNRTIFHNHSVHCVIRLRLGRRLVNLSPVAQRTNALTNGVVHRPWVVGREFESHVHHENAF